MKKNVSITPSRRALIAIENAIACGRDMVLIEMGEKRRMVSKRQAERLVGVHYLKVWEDNKLIKGIRHGAQNNSKVFYDLMRLHELQLSDTYCYFLE